MKEGLKHTSIAKVEAAMTALYIGSGDLEVLATPVLCAIMENAAMLAVMKELTAEQTTVGSKLDITHIRPTAVGGTISATATLTKVEEHKLTFSIEARDEKGIVGSGTHIRYIVERTRFLDKLNK